MTTLLLIVNDVDSQPRRYLEWLIDAHIDLDIRSGPAGTVPGPEVLDDYDGFMYFGGGYMPDDDAAAPWLRRERELALAALEAGRPQLGICLGGQLLAHIAGGEVMAQTGEPEKGAVEITLTPAAAEDRVFAHVPQRTHFIESHVDRITRLPAGAVLLASSAVLENQAFRIGNSWGLQFHPEASAESVHGWNAEELAKLGFAKDELTAFADSVEAESRASAHALLRGFIDTVTAH